VLEALALRVPVVASENGRRPEGVVRYEEMNADDLVAKLNFLAEHYEAIQSRLSDASGSDNVGRMADWLAGTHEASAPAEVVHAG
jgi:glycosyltransferase involved in cell wall biosynthesis